MAVSQPIGIFDSGYGGLTVLKEIVESLPGYDYIYLGDNARTPYGPRSFKTVYRYTLECVRWLFDKGCPLIILACNTASAKALRTIQQQDLPQMDPLKRVLGVIRPTSEVIGNYSKTGNVGILATSGTVISESYLIETHKFFPAINVFQEACPMWVPLIENNEHTGNGADYFVEKHIKNIFSQCADIDTLLLACTHYPLLKDKILQYLPASVTLISQGEIVAKSLSEYLVRHPDLELQCSKESKRRFFTTDSSADFDKHATVFFGQQVSSNQITL